MSNAHCLNEVKAFSHCALFLHHTTSKFALNELKEGRKIIIYFFSACANSDFWIIFSPIWFASKPSKYLRECTWEFENRWTIELNLAVSEMFQLIIQRLNWKPIPLHLEIFINEMKLSQPSCFNSYKRVNDTWRLKENIPKVWRTKESITKLSLP